MSTKCANCQSPLPPSARFCRQCGKPTDAGQEIGKANGSSETMVAEESAPAPLPDRQPSRRSGNATVVDMSGSLAPSLDLGGDEFEGGGGATLVGLESSLSVKLSDVKNLPNTLKAGNFVGQTVGGYVVDKKLGEGGMGAVYKAIPSGGAGKPIALKILHSEYAKDAKILERFFNEAKAVNQFHEPHIVDISDSGFLPTGHPFIAMELLDGHDLAAYLDEKKGVIPLQEAVDITLQVLAALKPAHGHTPPIIHRDLKPENVFMLKNKRKDGSGWFIKVLDFGIAKLSVEGSQQQTQAGTVLGTPRYMSPEQARGDKDISPSADIYCLGVMLYEMLTGRAPFEEANFLGYLVAHQKKSPPRPSELSPTVVSLAMEKVLLKCLEKTPTARYATPQEMIDALQTAVKEKPGAAPAASSAPVATPAPTAPATTRAPETTQHISSTPAVAETTSGSSTAKLVGILIALAVAAAAVAFFVVK